MAKAQGIGVGDHVSHINGTSLEGSRHFEVARMLKEIPIGSEFSVQVTHPKLAADAALAPRGNQGGSGNVAAGGGKKTMRMKKDGTAVIEEVNDEVAKMVTKIDDMLEQFATIFDLAKANAEADLFAGALDEKLSDFEFP